MNHPNSAKSADTPQDQPQTTVSARPSVGRRAIVLAIVAVALLAVVVGIGWEVARLLGLFTSPDMAVRFAPEVAPPAPDEPGYKAVAVVDPKLVSFPYAPGWPLALPGEIVATPAVADLLGDGHLEVIVPCFDRDRRVKYVHPHPNRAPLLFAIRADGSVLPGWPIKLQGGPWDRPVGGWASSPSVIHKSGGDKIVIAGPERTVYVIGGDRSMEEVGNTDATVAVPIVDLTGGGAIDLVSGGLAVDSDGHPINGFAAEVLDMGYCPCIGDANGDGHLEMFHLQYGREGHNYPLLIGFDATGKELPNWQKPVPMDTWRPPAMGDIDGSGTMSIVAGYGHTIFAWHNTGKPLEGTEKQTVIDGIFKRQILADTATPALADLTGSGHADIVVFDRATHQLHAWHADGSAVWPASGKPSTRPADDGAFAKLPTTAHGVSVASLGDDPKVMDFFVGTYWVRHFPDGRVTITNMLNGIARTEWAQPTIADLEHTGQADIIFGTTDGRLFVYRTGLAYHPERMEWPTQGGNFQHTGAWTPKKVAAASSR